MQKMEHDSEEAKTRPTKESPAKKRRKHEKWRIYTDRKKWKRSVSLPSTKIWHFSNRILSMGVVWLNDDLKILPFCYAIFKVSRSRCMLLYTSILSCSMLFPEQQQFWYLIFIHCFGFNHSTWYESLLWLFWLRKDLSICMHAYGRKDGEKKNIEIFNGHLSLYYTRSWMSRANHSGSALSNVEPLNASELRHCEIILN